MIPQRLVGAMEQNMLDRTQHAFFQDVEASMVLAKKPTGVRDEWMDVPLPAGLEFGVQIHRKERMKLFDTERRAGLCGDEELVPRRGRRGKYEKAKWVGYTIFKKMK